ncbi:MAG TPA: HD domain-containing protein [archaeon]|nr:HD domain-containing protein [archaeon]
MLMHVDHLIPGLELESDVRLKAGSFLITRKELSGGRLDEKVIESIQRFASQLAPENYKVSIKIDDRALDQLKVILSEDVSKITQKIKEGQEYPNFLKDDELQEKVMRIMEKLISNPDLIKNMYEFKVSGSQGVSVVDQLHDHSIRVTLLAIALGLKLRWSIISLVNVGMAGILHDMGIIKTAIYPNLKELDDYLPSELEAFVDEHQKKSVELFGEKNVTLLPFTKQEILHMITNHHRPDPGDVQHKTTLLLYFAELVDEMITPLLHRARYNFNQDQIKILGDRFARRNGLVNVMLALVKLHKGKGLAWQLVTNLISLFSLDELLIEGYEEMLKEIIDFCPFNCAVGYPHIGGNTLPRTIYCNNSTDPKFTCEHMGQVKIEIYLSTGKVKSYSKCATLTEQLHNLNKAGKEETEYKEKPKPENSKPENPKPENPKPENPKPEKSMPAEKAE